MKPNTILALQSAGVTAQILNGQIAIIAHHNAIAALVIGAIIGGFQFYVQGLGNKLDPNVKPPEK